MRIIKDKRVSMNETQIIKDALLSSCCEKTDKKSQKVMYEIDPIPFEEIDDDVTNRLFKQKARSQSICTKNVNNWTNTDFLRYIKYLSGLSGISCSVLFSSVKEREVISKIYDKIAFHIQQDMNNSILREYIEWWINAYSYLMSGKEIYPSILVFDSYINKFISRFRLQSIPGNGFSIHKNKEKEFTNNIASKNEPIDSITLYNHGGLPMVIMSKGIVASYVVLQEKGINSVFTKISTTLQKLSKSALQKTMEITLNNAPYSCTHVIDFIALARSALVYHNMKQYLSLHYKEYFKKTTC